MFVNTYSSARLAVCKSATLPKQSWLELGSMFVNTSFVLVRSADFPSSRPLLPENRRKSSTVREFYSLHQISFSIMFHLSLFAVSLSLIFPCVLCKSTIEPCSTSDSCNAMVGYTLYTDLKASEVGTLFQTDPIAILTANAIDISYPDVENNILPARLFLKIPVVCSCADGIRKSKSIRYKTRPADTLSFIADTVYSGLVSADQIQEANSISDPSVVDVGQNLNIPLPCTCFNSSDNSLPAIYLSYVVQPEDSVAGIASRYLTTVTDIMTVNAMGIPSTKAGDILAVPMPACASSFPTSASDFGMIVANGSYAITASHCVQCSCGPGNLNLYCTPASLAVSCSSMQCPNSNLMLGNVTSQFTSAGCNVTSCTYGGFINGSIVTRLSTSLQPQCPGVHRFPPLVVPPNALSDAPFLAPASLPSEVGGSGQPSPRSSFPGILPETLGFSPAHGPAGSTSDAYSLMKSLCSFVAELLLTLLTISFM